MRFAGQAAAGPLLSLLPHLPASRALRSTRPTGPAAAQPRHSGFNFAGFSSGAILDDLVTVDQSQRQNFKVLTYILAAAAGLMFLLTLIMLRRIKIAVACLKVASVAIDHMPSLLFFPLFTLSIFAAFIVWWVAVVVFLYACGEVKQDPATAQWDLYWTRNLQWVGIYHLFGLLWTIQAR